MILKHDCKFFLGDRPCVFHKQEGVICTNCSYYAPKGTMILIIKLDAIGDVLRTTSILNALKEKYSDSYITWLTKSNASDIFKNNNLVDDVLRYEENQINAILSVVEYDLVINLDPSPVSSALASEAKGITKLGFGIDSKGNVFPFNKEAEEWFEMGAFDNLKSTNNKTYQQVIHEICSLPYNKGKIVLNLSEEESFFAKKFYDSNHLSKYKKIIGINAGASNRWELKKWRFEGYVELMYELHKNYNCAFLLFGGKNETKLNEELKEACKNIFDTGSNNSIREFASCVSLCDVLITGDTLALHVSSALNVPSVCIFGPTSHAEIEDYGIVRKVYPNMDCLVCYKNKCDFKPNCMELVTAVMVLNEVSDILEN